MTTGDDREFAPADDVIAALESIPGIHDDVSSQTQMSKIKKPGFVDGTDRIERLLADPERVKRVATIREAGREMDRLQASPPEQQPCRDKTGE